MADSNKLVCLTGSLLALCGFSCSAIFGLDEGELASGSGGDGGRSGSGGSGGTTATGGVPGNGGTAGSTSGTGGASGQGGATGTGGTGGSAGMGGSDMGGGAGTAGGGVAGAGGTSVTCDSPEVACDGVCVTLAASGEHCGACNHTCGGGQCVLGKCSPADIATGGDAVDSFAVGPDELYFSVKVTDQEYSLRACPKDGCTLAPRQVVAMTKYISAIVYLPGTVVFESAPAQSTTRPALFACPAAGCLSVPTSFASDGLSGFDGVLLRVGNVVFYQGYGIELGLSTCAAGSCGTGKSLSYKGVHARSADDSHLYFVDKASNGSRLARCSHSPGPCAPSPLRDGDFSSVQASAVHGGRLYWAEPGRDSFYEGKVKYCAIAEGCSTVTTLATGLDSPETLLVDGSGSYWFLKEDGRLQHCSGSDCKGGKVTLTPSLASPKGLAADANFVYWLESGEIRRIAKP